MARLTPEEAFRRYWADFCECDWDRIDNDACGEGGVGGAVDDRASSGNRRTSRTSHGSGDSPPLPARSLPALPVNKSGGFPPFAFLEGGAACVGQIPDVAAWLDPAFSRKHVIKVVFIDGPEENQACLFPHVGEVDILARAQGPAPGEAVAWRYRFKTRWAVSNWHYAEGPKRPDLHDWDGFSGYDIEPLYAAILARAQGPAPGEADHIPDVGKKIIPAPGEAVDMLAWLSEHRRLELDYGYDDEFETLFWRVNERSGNINDREWNLIGQGATPLAALLSAKSFLEAATPREA